MFCPFCGCELTVSAGELSCVPGDMQLSRWMEARLRARFVERTAPCTAPGPTIDLGGRWFCPGCGIPMQTVERKVVCACCDERLDDLIYRLVELHPHRRD